MEVVLILVDLDGMDIVVKVVDPEEHKMVLNVPEKRIAMAALIPDPKVAVESHLETIIFQCFLLGGRQSSCEG